MTKEHYKLHYLQNPEIRLCKKEPKPTVFAPSNIKRKVKIYGIGFHNKAYLPSSLKREPSKALTV